MKHAKADSASLETLCVADQVCVGVFGVVDMYSETFDPAPLLRQILSHRLSVTRGVWYGGGALLAPRAYPHTGGQPAPGRPDPYPHRHRHHSIPFA